MSLSLQGTYALVTGSTDGLGKKTAFELARQGAHLIIHGRSQEKVARTVQELQKEIPSAQCHTIICDLEKPETVGKAFSSIERLDILINNAGVWKEGSTLHLSSKNIIELVTVNTMAPLLITRLLLPRLLQSDFGQIINVVSIAGVEIPFGYYHTLYTATKFAMQGFTEGLAKEFYNKNLRVMGYYPGGMETNIFKKAGNKYNSHEPWMFDPQESAEAILFMLTRNKKINLKRMDVVNQLEI